jgi:hypothetical protein
MVRMNVGASLLIMDHSQHQKPSQQLTTPLAQKNHHQEAQRAQKLSSHFVLLCGWTTFEAKR